MTDSLSSTLPDWIAAVASTLAFVAAGLAIYPAWRAFRLEQKRDDRAEVETVQMLPPGRYFMHSNETSWDFLTEVPTDTREYSPITDAKTHKVTGYSLTDSSGTRWAWQPATGIRRAR